MTAWQGDGRSHKGRRAANEDTFVCRDGDGLWAVIDGMGGHEAGDMASSMVQEALESLSLGGSISHRLVAVETALQSVNHAIRHHSAMHLGSKPMGATVVVLLIYKDEAAVLWAGDARLYQLTDGVAEVLSRDHTPVQALVDAGEINEEEAMRHPRAHVIYQAVGNGEKLKLDQSRFPVSPQQQYLLTSDGIHSVLKVAEVGQLMARGANATSVLKVALEAGSRDNVTAVCVRPTPEA